MGEMAMDREEGTTTFRRLLEMMGHRPREVMGRVEAEATATHARDEFMALSLWLGKCAFLHRLGPGIFPRAVRKELRAPSLFAVYTPNNRPVSLLVEVRSGSSEVLTFKTGAFEGLRRYAALVNRPCLVAWRCRGEWTLVDSEIVERGPKGYVLPLDLAKDNNLMDMILGSFYVSPVKEGIRWRWKIRPEVKEALEKVKRKEMRKFLETVGDFYYENAEGEKVPIKFKSPLFLMLVYGGLWKPVSYLEEENIVEGEDMYEAAGFPAYRLLQIAEEERAVMKVGGQVDWSRLAQRGTFRFPLRAVEESVEHARELKLGCDYIISIRPKSSPKFLKGV